MTYQHAKDIILCAIDTETECISIEVESDALCLAVIGLDKQIGKTPKWDNIYKCPRCGKIIGMRVGCFAFCYHRGQAIDWSDEDENG